MGTKSLSYICDMSDSLTYPEERSKSRRTDSPLYAYLPVPVIARQQISDLDSTGYSKALIEKKRRGRRGRHQAVTLFFVCSCCAHGTQAYARLNHCSISPLPLPQLYSDLQTLPDGFQLVRQTRYSPMSPAVNHYYRPSPQHPAIGHIGSAQLSETQPTSVSLQVTGTYLYDPSMTSTNPISPVSPSSKKPSPSQDLSWKEKTILRYYYLRGENNADPICAKHSPTRGMEREHGIIVGNLTFFFLMHN
jgi:hypothetical protein